MRCEDAQQGTLERTAAGASTDAAADAKLEQHLRECDACRSFAARQASLDRVLALDEPHRPGPGFDTRFFARLDAERRAQRRRRFSRWAWMLVPAAAGAIALLVRPASAPDEPPRGEDLELAMELELIEELPVVQQLETIEALDVLGEVDEAELARIVAEVK